MRRLALIFALLWWAQGPICLLPGPSHADRGDVATTAADHSDHPMHAHHGTSAQRDADAQLPDGDAGCEPHCASLSQALAPAASATPGFAALGLPLATAPALQPAMQRVAARSLDSHHGPPPPNLVIAHTSLLI